MDVVFDVVLCLCVVRVKKFVFFFYRNVVFCDVGKEEGMVVIVWCVVN